MTNVLTDITTTQRKYSAKEFQWQFKGLLSHCDANELDVLLDMLELKQHVPSNEVLIRQGEMSDTLYLVYNGLLSVTVDSSAKEVLLGMIDRGQWVGDVSLIEPGPASASVKVVEEATLLCLSHEDFEILRATHPKLASCLLNALSITLASRLRKTNDVVFAASTGSQANKPNDDQILPEQHWPIHLGRWLMGLRWEGKDGFDGLELEQRRIELEQKYKYLYSRERENVLASERERILAELHDGVGGQLVALLAMLEKGKNDHNPELLKDAVRAALDDLRLMIDSLDAIDGDIPVVLGMFRSRLEPRLVSQNIKFDWRVTDLPPVPNMGSHEVLQILRILQEAVTNIIKHACASIIKVSTGVKEFEKTTSSIITICIEDNGRGFGVEAQAKGYGMQTMQQRAKDIGGRLSIRSGSDGTSVSLIIPLDSVN